MLIVKNYITSFDFSNFLESRTLNVKICFGYSAKINHDFTFNKDKIIHVLRIFLLKTWRNVNVCSNDLYNLAKYFIIEEFHTSGSDSFI